MYYLGFDIGGTKCAVSLGKWNNQNVEILFRKEIPTKNCPIETFNGLAPFVKDLISKYPIKRAGVSCGGPLDSQNGVIISTPNLSEKWHGFEIVSYIKSRFNLDAKLENDANASAVAEWKFGAGKGAKNLVFMTFGTGLGAGLILDGKLYSGTNGNAGEIGHVRLEDDGPIGFNKKGSAEGFCSGNGILRLAEITAKEQGIVLSDSLTTKEIFEKAKSGDNFYLSVITKSAEKFAKVVSLVIDLFNPEIIVAGGVFMRNYEFFTSVMTPIIERESLQDSYSVCKILPAQIGENIGDYASLAIAMLEN
ncbi:MAG: ROK family protein [Clostridiales bacterium]|nr:ROK family protein [Clostridiales bacterium]